MAEKFNQFLQQSALAAEFVDLCCEGDLEGVRAGLQNGFDVNSKDSSNGQTGLIFYQHLLLAL